MTAAETLNAISAGCITRDYSKDHGGTRFCSHQIWESQGLREGHGDTQTIERRIRKPIKNGGMLSYEGVKHIMAMVNHHAHRALLVLKARDKTSNGGSETQAFAKQQRISWARLLARVFKIDVEVCPNCAGRMRIIAAITERKAIIRILQHLKLPTDLPKPSPARAPPQMTLNDFSDPYDQRTHDND